MNKERVQTYLKMLQVSVPSFGDSFFMRGNKSLDEKSYRRFRPLIRGFFFYFLKFANEHASSCSFPSPHSGILFLFTRALINLLIRKRKFPSPHSGILFLCEIGGEQVFSEWADVSVPSFGDSFFIIVWNAGIFSQRFRFRPLIRGFFFYLYS